MQPLSSINSKPRSRRRSSAASASANQCSPMTCFLFLTGLAFWASLALSFLSAVFYISLTQPNECDCCYAPDTPNGMSRYNNTLCSCETTASSGSSASKCADIISSSCPGRTYITSTLIGWETTFTDVECRTYLATGYAQLVACAATIFMVSIVLIMGYCDFHRLCTHCCRTIMRAITISNCDCHTTKAFNRHIKTKFTFYAILVLFDFIRTAIGVYFVLSTDKKPTFRLVAAVASGLSGLVAVRHLVGFCHGWYYKAEFVGAGSVSAEHDELLAV